MTNDTQKQNTKDEAILSDRQDKNLLFDFYGALLTTKQRDVFVMRTLEDCSLAEVAKEYDITPQGAADFIKRANMQLEKYESALGLVEKFKAQSKIAEDMEVHFKKLESLGWAEITEKINAVRALSKELML